MNANLFPLPHKYRSTKNRERQTTVHSYLFGTSVRLFQFLLSDCSLNVQYLLDLVQVQINTILTMSGTSTQTTDCQFQLFAFATHLRRVWRQT